MKGVKMLHLPFSDEAVLRGKNPRNAITELITARAGKFRISEQKIKQDINKYEDR